MRFRINDCSIDTDTYEVRRCGVAVPVEPQVFDLLVYLLVNRDRIVTKQEIINSVWKGRIVSEAAISSRIKAVRRLIGDNGTSQTSIQTVKRRGFRVVAAVTECASPSTHGLRVAEREENGPDRIESLAGPAIEIKDSETIGGAGGRSFLPWRIRLPHDYRWAVLRAAWAAGLLLILIAAWAWWPTPPNDSAPASATVAQVRPQTIVVLPFADLTGESGHDQMLDALVEDLTIALSRLRDVFVISQRSAVAYKNKQVDPRLVGQELGVRYVVQGSVRRRGGDMQASVQLVDSRSGAQLWAEPLDYRPASAVDAPNPAVASIAQTLGLAIIDTERDRSLRERPESSDAQDLIARARALVVRGPTRSNNEEARALFEAAIERDPSVVSALLGAAEANLFSVLNQWAPQSEWMARLDRADELLMHAIALAPRDARLRSSRGSLLRARGEPEQAIAAFEHAIRLMPNHAPSHAELGRTKLDIGLATEAIAHIDHALRLSPRDPSLFIWSFWAGQAALYAGDDTAAVKWLRQAIEANPKFRNPVLWLAIALERSGREDEAQRSFDEFRITVPNATISQWDQAYQRRHPTVVAQRAPIYASLRRLGMPE